MVQQEKIKRRYNFQDLDDYKEALFEKIDTKTRKIIGEGFDFDGKKFSLSQAAQSNWTNIKTNKVDFSLMGLFPLQISTIDNNIYMLQETDVDSFWSAGMAAVKGAYTSGSDIKKQVFDSTTIADLNAIVDNR